MTCLTYDLFDMEHDGMQCFALVHSTIVGSEVITQHRQLQTHVVWVVTFRAVTIALCEKNENAQVLA